MLPNTQGPDPHTAAIAAGIPSSLADKLFKAGGHAAVERAIGLRAAGHSASAISAAFARNGLDGVHRLGSTETDFAATGHGEETQEEHTGSLP